MDQAVDAVLDADEDTELGDVAHAAPDGGADGVAVVQQRPGVGLDLLHAKADPLVLDVDVQDHAFDLVSDRQDLARVLDPLGPRDLGDVDQTVDPLF